MAMTTSEQPRLTGTESSLGHVPRGQKWEFDDSVTAVFDDMLARSIPQYQVMRNAVTDMGCTFVKHSTDVVDLGCSRGEALAPLVERFGAYNRFLGVEVSPPMLSAARDRFKGLIDAGVVDIRELDLRRAYPPARASLTLSVLTLQFTPIEYRQRIVQNVFDHTLPGGAFILVEKVIGATAAIDDILVRLYLAMKGENGYSREEIERKRLSLEGVLVPVTAKWNEELLRSAGFREIDCFWRWMNFAAWVAVR
jgi:tRNA (cmo5U34)-methyltransferase